MKYVEASNNRELQGRKSMGQEKCIFGCHPLPPEKKNKVKKNRHKVYEMLLTLKVK